MWSSLMWKEEQAGSVWVENRAERGVVGGGEGEHKSPYVPQEAPREWN